MKKQRLTEFLIFGKIEKNNKELHEFLDFIYNNKITVNSKIINIPFLKNLDYSSYFIQLFPLESIPNNEELLSTFYKEDEFQFQSLVYEDKKQIIDFFDSFSKLIEKENIYMIYRTEEDLLPIIRKASKNKIIELDIVRDEEEFQKIWQSEIAKKWVKTKKVAKKQLIFNNNFNFNLLY